MRIATLMVAGALALSVLPSTSSAVACYDTYTQADIEAVLVQAIAARDAAQRALSDGGARPESVTRLITHLDTAIVGTPDPQIDGLKEMLEYYLAHPASPGQLFGATNRLLDRLQKASDVAAIAVASWGRATPPAVRTDADRREAYERTTSAFEKLAHLWRPISECYMRPYL